MYVIIRKGQQAQENEVVRRMRDNQYSRYEEMANGLVVTNAEQMLREYGERPICPKCERDVPVGRKATLTTSRVLPAL